VLSHSKLDETKEVPVEFMIKQEENTQAELKENSQPVAENMCFEAE